MHGIETSKYKWNYLHIASRMYSQGRLYAKVFSGYSCIQSKVTVEWGGTFEFQSVPYKLGVMKARSVRSLAARLNLTDNPGRSSLVQFRFVHVDGSTSSSNRPSVKNQGTRRISDKRKRCGSSELKVQLAAASAAVATPAVSLSVSLLRFPSWHCFRNPDALDPRLCLVRNVR